MTDQPSASQPWDDAELLDSIAAFIARFVWFPLEVQLWAVALWVLHTHAIDAADATPYLHIQSPLHQCGKSRLLEVLYGLVRRALVVANTTATSRCSVASMPNRSPPCSTKSTRS